VFAFGNDNARYSIAEQYIEIERIGFRIGCKLCRVSGKEKWTIIEKNVAATFEVANKQSVGTLQNIQHGETGEIIKKWISKVRVMI